MHGAVDQDGRADSEGDLAGLQGEALLAVFYNLLLCGFIDPIGPRWQIHNADVMIREDVSSVSSQQHERARPELELTRSSGRVPDL